MRQLTLRELIVEVQTQVQRLGSFKRDKTSESLIVWKLNAAQNRFIKKRIKPDPNNPNRYLVDEKSNSDIQKLITPNTSIQMYKDTDSRVFGFLPYDFMYLINDRSRVLPDCKDEFSDPLLAGTYPTQTVYTFAFPEAQFSDGATYYKSLTVQSTVSSVVTTKSRSTAGTTSTKEQFEVITAIISLFKQLGYAAYWEEYADIYELNSFIVPNAIGQPLPDFNITIDSLLVKKVTTTKAPNGTSFRPFKPFDSSILSEAPNRGYKGDFLYDAITHNYYDRPTTDSPVSQLAQNKLYVFNDKRFLVSETLIDYIRTPRPISLYLNQTCELDGSVHEEICSIAAELMLSNIESPVYPTKVQENITRLE